MFDSPPVQLPVACLVAYLVGALPFGLLIALARGVDIRSQGSGNIGATNVFRCVGKPWGVLAYLLDMCKGLFGVLLVPMLLHDPSSPPDMLLAILSGCSTIVGHNWPIYLKFKGGKGIATSSGVLLGLAPGAVGVGLAVWLLALVTTRYVSVASILASVAVALFGWLRYEDAGPLLPGVLTGIAVLAILRHRPNIQRLFSGTENRFEFKKKAKADPTP